MDNLARDILIAKLEDLIKKGLNEEIIDLLEETFNSEWEEDND
jgi:hypothetical protein